MDAISLEIHWARAIAIANEMMETLIRTSFSTVIRVNRDCSSAIFDENGRMIAQPSHSAPGHIGCMPGVMRRILEEYPADSIHDGDVFITNDPWIGAGHSPDIYIGAPIFRSGRRIAFAVTVAHHIDIGGRVGPTDSQDVFEEGLLIPLSKLYQAGKPNEQLFRIIQANVRLPHIVLGDFDAQMAANRVGAERLLEMADDFGLPGFAEMTDAITAATEKAMRAAIEELPDGTYRIEKALELKDENDRPVVVKAEIDVKGGAISVDYSGTSSQVRRPINCVLNYAMSYTVLAFKMALLPDLPYNEGTQLPIRVRAPEGCVLNPRRPAAVWRRAILGMELPDIIFDAIACAVPDKVIAGSGSTPMWLWLLSGWRPERKRFVFQTHFMGGLGARYAKDGLSTAAFPYNMTDSPVEVIENSCPIVIHRRKLLRDSAGAGRFRGGLGQEVAFSPAPSRLGHIDGALTASFSAGHLKNGPVGVNGGRPGAPAMVTLNGAPLENLLTTVSLEEKDTLTVRLPGGGGYHPPEQRNPEAVRNDVLEGLVSVEAARSIYRVALRGSEYEVDAPATESLRAGATRASAPTSQRTEDPMNSTLG